jgi:methionine biosynthesis protein MetW
MKLSQRFESDRYDLALRHAKGGERVMDIGCGEGDLLIQLNNSYNEVWGIDISELRIDRVRKKINQMDSIHVRQEDANMKLEFPDHYFDTIIVIAVLEHVFDPYEFIHECHRLLHPGGQLIIDVPNVAFFPNRLRLLVGLLPITSNQRGWDGGHLHYFTKSTLKKLIQDMGFEISTISHGGVFSNFRKIWGAFLCGDIFIVGIKK